MCRSIQSISRFWQRVTEITRRVWSKMDCTACANCCKTVAPTLSEADVDRLARRLKIDRQAVIQRYLQPDDRAFGASDNPRRMRTTPCSFLENNRCTVYEDRPTDCRGYPYLEEPDFVFRTAAMIGRTFTCPTVFEMMEELKPAVGFRRQRSR